MRSTPDFGAQFPQLLTIKNQPAIPISDSDSDPNALVPLLQSLPITDPKPRRMQAIANTAGLHFAFVEQGGSSLYPILALKGMQPAQNSLKRGTARREMVEFNIPFPHAKRTNTGAAPHGQPGSLAKGRQELLVGAEEVVVGRIRYQRLLTDVGGCRASGSRSGSSLCI